MERDLKKRLRRSVKGIVSFGEYLKDHTTFRIGGMPRAWIEPESLEDLRSALRIFSLRNVAAFLIGNGSNILAYGGRLDKAAIKLSAPDFKRIEFRGSSVICGPGLNLSGLIRKSIERGLSGLEPLAGIPGTVGGAIMMNAGIDKKNNIGNLIKWVRVMDYKGKRISILKKESLNFRYRDSGLSEYIILEAQLKLKKSTPRIAQKRFSGFLQGKLKTQEYRWPNAGCIFRNPQGSRLRSAQLLEQCGLKGLRVGSAQVSTKHANFIINKGRAKFDDVVSLMKLVQDTVKKRCGVKLEPEIKIIR